MEAEENSENIAPCTAPYNNELIVTNEILFGIVRSRHCKEGVLNRVAITDTGPEFRKAIQETIEFLFQKEQNSAFFPSQKSWSGIRAKYLSTQFAKKWKEVCMISLDNCSFHWDLILLRYLFRYKLA